MGGEVVKEVEGGADIILAPVGCEHLLTGGTASLDGLWAPAANLFTGHILGLTIVNVVHHLLDLYHPLLQLPPCGVPVAYGGGPVVPGLADPNAEY